MKAGKLLNRTIFTVLSLHLISACQTGKNPELVKEKPTIASYYQRADWEGMIPPSPPIPIPVPNIECREKTVTLPPGTLTHPKYKYLNINICRRVRPPYTDEDKRDKLTLLGKAFFNLWKNFKTRELTVEVHWNYFSNLPEAHQSYDLKPDESIAD